MIGATKHIARDAIIALAVAVAAIAWGRSFAQVFARADRLQIQVVAEHNLGGRIDVGTYRVFEDRDARAGRELELKVVVLHALGEAPEPDPTFILAGGPGVDVTMSARAYARSWLRQNRDIVLVSQRGTGGSHRLDFPDAGEDESAAQAYLSPGFDLEAARAALENLQPRADLTKYSTPIAMDDLNDVRRALGYGRINLMGGSYGTRAALVYMRRHPDTVRTAVLNGVAPIAFTNPLHHARGAQDALEMVFEEVENDPVSRKAFPDLRAEFDGIVARLAEAPAKVTLTDARTGEVIEVELSRDAFAEALRTMLYRTGTSRAVPYLIHRAADGDFEPFARTAIKSNRSIRRIIAFGMLLCVTCAEDVERIEPESIPRETEGTFTGDLRVRRQMAICEFWPKSELPDDFGEPVSVDVPTLVLSGSHDPVTPPRWGEETVRHLPNGRHIVVPGAHGVGGPCVDDMIRQFLDAADVEAIDASCVDSMRLPRLRIE